MFVSKIIRTVKSALGIRSAATRNERWFWIIYHQM